MAELRFQEQVTYGKPTSVDIHFAASHCVSSSVAQQFVYFVTKPELQAKAQSAGGIAGLTVGEFSLAFQDFANQWRCVPQGGIKNWVFQGGTIFLKSLVKIYVDDRFRTRTDLLDLIMEHEFMHVADEILVLSKDVPARLRDDSIVRQHLIQKMPVDNAMFENWFKTSKFQDYVEPVYAEEHNRRGRHRDSGMEYARYINSISTRL
jgi:hypothetical protein